MIRYRLASILILLFIAGSFAANAQNSRLNDDNSIGWYQLTANHKLSKKWSAQVEYQWRRTGFITGWQQSVLRPAVNYHALPNVQLQLAACWAQTYNYGEIPVNSLGKEFPEYRIHEQVLLSQDIARFSLQYRLRLEQRWIAKYNAKESEQPDSYVYANRFRYMMRAQSPLQGKTLDDHEFYGYGWDELLIAFGKNVGENIFDQNRISAGIGYRLNKHLRAEAGYIGQWLQLGREVNNRNVLQYNNGFVISVSVNTGNGK